MAITTEITGVKDKIKDSVWGSDIESAPFIKKIVLKSLRIVHAVLRDLADGQLSLRAMSLVYTTVISLVPLLALSFSVLKGFGAHNQLEPMLHSLLAPLGEKSSEISAKIIQFVDNVKVGILGTVGLGLLVYSVVSMMQKIERSFNYTWRISKGRSFAQRFSDYLSVLLVGPLLIFLSVGITASIRTNAIIQYLSNMPIMGELLEVVGLIIPYFIMALAFAFVYSYMPNTRVKLKSAFIGGLVTAIIWKTMGWVFTIFVVNSKGNAAIYSAFASLIIFMFWIYMGWLVLLIGASIAFYHQNPKAMMVNRNQLDLENEAEEKLAITICYLIAKSYYNKDKAWTLERLSEYFMLPEPVIERILGFLEKAGFLIQSQNPSGYFPAQPIEKIRVKEILDAIRQAGKNGGLQMQKNRRENVVENFFTESDQLIAEKLGNVTLRDMIKT